MADLIEVCLKKLAYCPRTSLPILILESRDGSYFLPVFVSYPEWGLLTHPSFQTPWLDPALWPFVEGLLGVLQARVREVRIEREGARFLGHVVLDGLSGERTLRMRAGEAIAVAVRTNAAICMRKDQAVPRDPDSGPPCRGDDRELLDWLRRARPEDFSSKDVGRRGADPRTRGGGRSGERVPGF